MDDGAALVRQLGRQPRALLRVAVRCPWGRPAVTEQAPYDADGNPFPTTYWLTCPHLVAAISRAEAGGGVERWGEAAENDPELHESLEAATRDQRELRASLAGGARGRDDGSSLASGIGGAARPERLKCLHAHVAWALAHPPYALGEAIVREAGGAWPTGRCCLDGL
ncbi:MAG TPA: DUF501 domain-containing protein [Gaiellaceae bacterium]|nr:DUF501 domain-containing protein [Gaiellaceae bacterium]